ncbi:MAG: hypothetical protein AB1458_09365 [Bacteroidota bacterium]
MTPSEELFQLIKSLTPNEKGYFKKFSKLHVREGKNNYMRLFEAIDRQERYDERALLREFSNEQFVKQFPVAKNYLFNLILKALDVYHSEVDLEIGYLIHCSLMLMDKAMYDSAYKYLKKAKAMAIENSKLSYLNKILHHELQLLRNDVPVKLEWHREALYRERIESANQILYIVELQNLNDRMQLEFNKSFGAGRKSVLKDIEQMMKHPLMKSDPARLSIYAQVEFWSIKMYYHTIRSESQQLFKCSLQLVSVLNKYWDVLNTRTKIMILQNHCTTCMMSDRMDLATETLEKLRSIHTTEAGDNLAVFQFVRLHELHIFMKTGQYEKSRSVIDNIEKELGRYEDKIQNNYRGFLISAVAMTYFANGQHKEALRWAGMVLNSKLSDYRSDIVAGVKLLEMLIFYETGKIDLFDSKLRSYERQCNKHREGHAFELLVLARLRNLLRQNKPDNFGPALKRFRDDVAAHLKKFPADRNVFYDFDILQWIDSKLTGVPLNELIAGKAR